MDRYSLITGHKPQKVVPQYIGHIVDTPKSPIPFESVFGIESVLCVLCRGDKVVLTYNENVYGIVKDRPFSWKEVSLKVSQKNYSLTIRDDSGFFLVKKNRVYVNIDSKEGVWVKGFVSDLEVGCFGHRMNLVQRVSFIATREKKPTLNIGFEL